MLLNNKPFDRWHEGITIEDVIKIMNYIYPKLVIKVNDVVIDREDCNTFVLKENDDLKIHHLLAGG